MVFTIELNLCLDLDLKKTKHCNMDTTYLWHYILGHANFTHILSSKRIQFWNHLNFRHMMNTSHVFLGKMTKLSFVGHSKRARELLSMTYSDVYGSLKYRWENQLGNSVKFLRFDWGEEYLNEKLRIYLKQFEIISQYPPNMLQHIDVSTWRIWTLMDMVWFMRSFIDLPTSL